MELTIYNNFSKRINSTKRPTGGTVVDVVMKQGTSIEEPVFLIDGVDLSANYCKFNNQYYYINDIVLGNNNIYELHCSVDYMATNKGAIGATSAYVEYAASEYNKWIPDTRLSMSDEVEVRTNSIPFWLSATEGSVILTVAGKNESAQVGFTTAYGITDSSLTSLNELFYNPTWWEEIKRMWDDPYTAIIEAHWVPWSVSKTGTYISIGNDSTDISAGGLKSQMSISPTETAITIPWIYEDWRDFAPYASMQLYLPFYGTVTLDQAKFKNETDMTISMLRDAISGEVNYTVKCGSFISTYKCDAAVSLAIGQTNGQKVQGITGIAGGAGAALYAAVSMAGAYASGGTATLAQVAMGVGGVAAMGAGVVTAFSESESSKGGTGGFAAANQIIKSPTTDPLRYARLTLIAHKFGVSDPENVNTPSGRPLFEVKTLGELSGYIKCSNASVNVGGMGGEKEAVNTMLNNGFYYE